jgi:sugar lactone lactonase YvrE
MSALALSAGASAWAGEEVTVDGVPHIKNVATPSQGRETLKLEEIWRVGGDNEDDLLLALITEVCRDEKGNIYALDSQLCNVHVFSPQGELLRTLFAQGEGPGETLRPRDLVVTKDGVGVAEEFPSKVIMVDREGLPLDNVYLTTQEGENLGALMGAGFGGGNLILSGVEVTQGDTPGTQNRLYFLGCFSDTGKERFRYCESSSQYNFQKYSFVEKEHIPSFWWGFEVAPDGTVYAACDRENYAISVFSPDGKLVRVIEREFQPYTRTEKDKKWMHDLIASATGELPFEVKYVFEDNEPVIDFFHRGLRIDGDGNLWVTTSRGLRDNADGALMTYDVFDPDGHFTRQVAVECEGDSFYDCLFWISDDQVVLLTGAMAALAAQFGSGSAVDSSYLLQYPARVVATVERHCTRTILRVRSKVPAVRR